MKKFVSILAASAIAVSAMSAMAVSTSSGRLFADVSSNGGSAKAAVPTAYAEKNGNAVITLTVPRNAKNTLSNVEVRMFHENNTGTDELLGTYTVDLSGISTNQTKVNVTVDVDDIDRNAVDMAYYVDVTGTYNNKTNYKSGKLYTSYDEYYGTGADEFWSTAGLFEAAYYMAYDPIELNTGYISASVVR